MIMASYKFTPSNTTAFSFQPTLDGVVYNIIVVWSLFGQRYYVNCYTNTGSLVFSLPLIGSLDSIHIQAANWNNGFIVAKSELPHNFRIGDIVDVSIVNFLPTIYNGRHQATMTSDDTFTYELTSDPGSVVSLGDVQYNINLAAGYFNSTLVYRANSQTFEVTP